MIYNIDTGFNSTERVLNTPEENTTVGNNYRIRTDRKERFVQEVEFVNCRIYTDLLKLLPSCELFLFLHLLDNHGNQMLK